MFSIQEICDKYKPQLKNVRDHMDRTAEFHPEDASVYAGLNPVERQSVRETLKAIPYSRLKEYLSRGTTIGNYLVGDKIHDDLIDWTIAQDLAPAVGEMVNGWEGGDLLVDIVNPKTYRASYFVSGAALPSETIETKKATLSPVSFGIAPRIGGDLVEDTSFNGDLIAWHLKLAAQAMTWESNNLCLTVLKTGTDGFGTLNTSVTGDADSTKYTSGTTYDVRRAALDVGRDQYHPNTMIVTEEAWRDQIMISGAAAVLPIGIAAPNPPIFPFRLGVLDVALCNVDCLHLAADADGTFTDCVTLIFDRNNAILTGRKRWMRMENYVEPFKDLAGMVITARQDSVTLQNDAIFNLYET